MRRLVSVRVLSAVALLASGTFALGATAAPASAAVKPVTCSVFNVSIKGVGTMSGCTDKPHTGGSGKFVANTKKSPYSAKITWKGTGTTTTSLTYNAPTKKSICPKGQSEIDIKGTVTAGTGAALKAIPKKTKVSAVECYNTKAKPAVALTLAKKHVLSI